MLVVARVGALDPLSKHFCECVAIALFAASVEGIRPCRAGGRPGSAEQKWLFVQQDRCRGAAGAPHRGVPRHARPLPGNASFLLDSVAPHGGGTQTPARAGSVSSPFAIRAPRVAGKRPGFARGLDAVSVAITAAGAILSGRRARPPDQARYPHRTRKDIGHRDLAASASAGRRSLAPAPGLRRGPPRGGRPGVGGRGQAPDLARRHS